MIVAPDFQRQALGRHLLDALLHLAERRSITVLGLVATPFGRPLYEQRQFTPVGETVTLVGTPDLPEAAEPAAPLPGVDVALRVEQRWMACSRLPMLRARFQEATATSSLTGADGEVCSYAMATAQGALTLVGPIIAQTDGHARSLLCSLLGSLQGPARIDVPAEQRQFRDWLQSVGFCEQNARVAMIRGAGQLPWQVPQRFALAAQAWG
jgi:hypothetical protein